MARKASGIEDINHESLVLGHIGQHFNNTDYSDVTLSVGQQVFAAHRFILGAQSPVFCSLLLGQNWKESLEQEIRLEESSDSEYVFSDFLKFFYTGKLTLTSENVCGINTLADKYDVPSLKEDSLGFMKDVLTGIHGDALTSSLTWLSYIEAYVPDMTATCYSAIRTNFVGLTMRTSDTCPSSPSSEWGLWDKFKGKLTVDQLTNILSTPDDRSDEMVISSERNLFVVTKVLPSTKGDIPKLLPLIRFGNMEVDYLHSLEENVSELKDYCNHAYKVHAERGTFANREYVKKRRLSNGNAAVQCRCPANQTCVHMNPRLGISSPFTSLLKERISVDVEPVDLSNLETYSQRVLFKEARERNKSWKVRYRTLISHDPVCENYVVTPDDSHIGRKFSLAVVCLVPTEDAKCKKHYYRYTVKNTGVVKASESNSTMAQHIILNSPLRFKGSSESDARKQVFMCVILHK